MDLSKFKTSDWLVIGGGLGFLIFGTFFDWAKIDFGGLGSASGGNAFDFFLTGTVPWILLVGAAVITVLRATGTLKPSNVPWPLIILAATGLGALLVIIRLLVGPGDSLDRAIGLILSPIAAIAAAAGGFLGFKESGGDVNDLKDFNKLKGSFSSGGSGPSAGGTPPPPPPPGPSAPPPPPPPV